MNLELTEQQLEYRALTRQITDDVLRPIAAERDHTDLFPADELEMLSRKGLMGINVSSEYGGSEAGVVAYSLAITEIGRGDASVGVTMSVNNMVCEVLEQFGTPAQRAAFIPPITSGESSSGAFCLSEPGSGSDAAGMLTRARETDDGWIIDGTKAWITSGAHASVFLVWAQTEIDGKDRISAFVVPADTPGISVGKAEEKMGQHGSNTVTLTFEDVRIPKDAVLGDLGRGFRIAMMALDGGRIGVASLAVGIADEALTETIRLVRQIPALANSELAQARIGQMSARVEAARALVLRAAYLKENKVARFTREASMAKVFATEAATHVTAQAVELLGEAGSMPTSSLERLFRDARVTRIYEGTSEIQRIVIARDLLSQYAG